MSARGGGRAADGAGPATGSKRSRADGDEAQARIQALEEALAAEQAARAHDVAKLEFLGEKVRSVAERSRNRGNMLVRLLAALRGVERAKGAVEAAKAELATAELDLASVLQQATTMMAEEEQGGAKAAQQQQQQQPGSTPGGVAQASGPPPPPPEPEQGPHHQAAGSHGGEQGVWQGTGDGGAGQAGGPTGRMPMTFKIKM